MCFCDDFPDLIAQPNFFCILGQPIGLRKLSEQIHQGKRDFQGRKISILGMAIGSWERVWRHVLKPYSFRSAHGSWKIAYGGLFDPFITRHNFTFDLLTSNEFDLAIVICNWFY